MVSIRKVLSAICLTCAVGVGGRAHAQSVVVRHSVVAQVAPLLSVRDSGWTRSGDAEPRLSWSAEVRTNTITEIQVFGPRVQDPVAHARSGQGAWVRLRPDEWNTITINQPGRTRVTVEVFGDAVREPPLVRISAR